MLHEPADVLGVSHAGGHGERVAAGGGDLVDEAVQRWRCTGGEDDPARPAWARARAVAVAAPVTSATRPPSGGSAMCITGATSPVAGNRRCAGGAGDEAHVGDGELPAAVLVGQHDSGPQRGGYQVALVGALRGL